MIELKIKKHTIKFQEKIFREKNGKYFFIDDKSLDDLRQKGDSAINNLKIFIKKNGKVYFLLQLFLYPILFINGKNKEYFLKTESSSQNPADEIIVNIGSGNNTDDRFINVDIFPFEKVDIIADAHDLPFMENSIDKIIIEASIEHMANPAQAIKEIYRVLKKGGALFIVAPFIVGYHDSPSDYWRWTKEGLKMLLKDFKIVEIGNKGGIASALGWILAEFIATILSFGYKPLHFVLFHLTLIPLIPLKFLDFIFVYYSTTSNISSLFYAIARKK